MTEPAYGGAQDQGSHAPHAQTRPDPRASGWGAAQQAMIFAAESNVLAVRELADRPGDPAALEMVRLTITVLERLGETLRQLSFDEAVFDEAHDSGWREGYEACKSERCRLEVVNGRRAASGPR